MRRALIAVLALTACAQRTELVVGIATNLSPAQLSLVRVTVSDTTGARLAEEHFEVGNGVAGLSLPGAFGLSPNSDTTQKFLVRVDGGLARGIDAEGNPQLDVAVSRRANLGFVAGKTLFYRMALAASCSGALDGTCAASEWCVAGLCRALDVDPRTLPVYTSGAEYREECGEDGATFGLMGGGACPSGQSCVDGLCVASSGDPLADAAADDAALADLAMTAPSDATIAADAPPSDDASAILDGAISLEGGAAIGDAASSDAAMVSRDGATTRDAASAAPDLAMAMSAPLPKGVFSWVSPLPQGDAINAISSDGTTASGALLWAVTSGGTAVGLDASGGATIEDTGAKGPLQTVLVLGANVWAAGTDGAIHYRSSPGRWLALPLEPNAAASVTNGTAIAMVPTGAASGYVYFEGAYGGEAAGAGVRFDTTGTFVADLLNAGLYTALGSSGSCLSALSGRRGQFGTVSSVPAGSFAWQSDVVQPPKTISMTSILGCDSALQMVGGGDASGAGVVLSKDASLGTNVKWVDTALPASLGSVLALSAVDPQLATVFALANNNSGSGDSVALARYDARSAQWTPLPDGPLDAPFLLASGTTSGSPSAVVSDGVDVAAFAGGAWTRLTAGAVTHINGKPWGSGTTLVTPATSDVWITTDGTTWRSLPITAKTSAAGYTQVVGAPSGKLFVATLDGLVLSGTSAGLDTLELDAGAGVAFNGVWALDDTHALAVGTDTTSNLGVVYARRGGGAWALDFTLAATSTPSALSSVFGFASDDVYSVGSVTVPSSGQSAAAFFHWDGTAWSAVPVNYAPSGGSANDVWGSGANDVWAVGAGAVLYHLATLKTGFLAQSSPVPAATLTALHGSGAGDVWAVGSGGTVVRWDGTSWTSAASHTSADLLGVWVDADNVWIGGGDSLLRQPR